MECSIQGLGRPHDTAFNQRTYFPVREEQERAQDCWSCPIPYHPEAAVHLEGCVAEMPASVSRYERWGVAYMMQHMHDIRDPPQ